jgi:thiamine-monophosphate kinase
LVGSGDDAAVVKAGGALSVVSTDMVVEGVHFRLREGWQTPAEVGRSAMVAALSDLAAMGARPGEAYVSLGLPSGFSQEQALELVAAADAVAADCSTAVLGGDVVAAPALIVSVTVIGWADRAEDLARRSGAAPGDLVGVTGRLGAPGALLAVREGRAEAGEDELLELKRTAFHGPRLQEGRALVAAGVSAMIDVSDGLATDARHLARAGGVQLTLRLEDLPIAGGVAEVADRLGLTAGELAAASGEEYELCFCAPPGAREAVERAGEVTWIGEVGAGTTQAVLLGGGGEAVRVEGFEHRW